VVSCVLETTTGSRGTQDGHAGQLDREVDLRFGDLAAILGRPTRRGRCRRGRRREDVWCRLPLVGAKAMHAPVANIAGSRAIPWLPASSPLWPTPPRRPRAGRAAPSAEDGTPRSAPPTRWDPGVVAPVHHPESRRCSVTCDFVEKRTRRSLVGVAAVDRLVQYALWTRRTDMEISGRSVVVTGGERDRAIAVRGVRHRRHTRHGGRRPRRPGAQAVADALVAEGTRRSPSPPTWPRNPTCWAHRRRRGVRPDRHLLRQCRDHRRGGWSSETRHGSACGGQRAEPHLRRPCPHPEDARSPRGYLVHTASAAGS